MVAAAASEDPPPEGDESGAGDEELEEPLSVVADPSNRPTAGIEEIIITGVPLEDARQHEAVSSTTFSAEELRGLRIQKISDLADHTANLEINTRAAASNPTLFIRGIGLKDYNANAAGAVAIYRDGININSPAIQLQQLFDLRNVEVLRGPQGSLNGRNATAGAIHLHSALPEPEFGFQGSFTYGNYNTIEAEGAVNIPLFDEVLSSRVAFTANFADGNTENLCANWNPEARGFNRVDRQSTEDVYAALQPGAEQVEVFVGLQGRRRQDVFPYLTGDRDLLDRFGVTLGRLTSDPDRVVGIQEDLFSRADVDRVCILRSPGSVVTHQGAFPTNRFGGSRNPFGMEGEWNGQNVPTLQDFQGLKPKLNNVHNWGARGTLRFQPGLIEGMPSILEGMDWILRTHGSQNDSDSRHLSMLGANSTVDGTFVETTEPKEGGFSEAQSGLLSGLEGVRTVRGLVGANGPNTGLGGSDPFKGWYNQDGDEILDNIGGSLIGTWDLGSVGDVDTVVLQSLTGVEWYERFIQDEGDANPLAIFPAEWSDRAQQISQELRVAFETTDASLTAGFFFLTESLESFNRFPDTRQFELEQSFDQVLTSWAPYLGGSLALSRDLRVEAGVRYNSETKDFTLMSSAVGTDSGQMAEEIPAETVSETWAGVTGDLALYWEPFERFPVAGELTRNESLIAYAKYGRGMKGGHFNAGLAAANSVVSQTLEPVDPEFIHAIELGAKSVWFEDRLTLNLAAFRYWYEGYQVFTIANEIGVLPFQKLLNADARVWGAELEVQARPLPGLLLQASAGWLDSEFVDFQVQKFVLNARGTPDSQTFNYSGNPLIAAPAYSLAGVAEYSIPLWGYGWLVPQYDFSYRSKQFLDPQGRDPISQEPYWLHGARLAYRTEDERIEVAGWVQNFMDERYRVDVFDLTREFDTILEVWGDPRTFGITLSYRW